MMVDPNYKWVPGAGMSIGGNVSNEGSTSLSSTGSGGVNVAGTGGTQLGSTTSSFTSSVPVINTSVGGTTTSPKTITVVVSMGTGSYRNLFSVDSIGYQTLTWTLATGMYTTCGEPKDHYEFGYNGQMKSNEIAGMGNHNTAEFWEYDTRLGRRWNLDPKPSAGNSPFNAFGCNPIIFADLLGDTTNYFSKLGQLIETVNDQSPYRRVMVEEAAYMQIKNDRDPQTPAECDAFVKDIESQLGAQEKSSDRDLIAFENGNRATLSGVAEDVVIPNGNTRQQADVVFSLYSKFDNGLEALTFTANGRSGPWENGVIPNGRYSVGKDQMVGIRFKDGWGTPPKFTDQNSYKYPLSPLDWKEGPNNGNRFALKIHPTPQGGAVNTEGCVGLRLSRAIVYDSRLR